MSDQIRSSQSISPHFYIENYVAGSERSSLLKHEILQYRPPMNNTHWPWSSLVWRHFRSYAEKK